MLDKRPCTETTEDEIVKRIKTEDGSSTERAIDCDRLEDVSGEIERVTAVQVRDGEVSGAGWRAKRSI